MNELQDNEKQNNPHNLPPEVESRLKNVAVELNALAEYFKETKALDIKGLPSISVNTGSLVDLAAAFTQSAITERPFAIIQFPDNYLLDFEGRQDEGITELYIDLVPQIPAKPVDQQQSVEDIGCLVASVFVGILLLAILTLVGIGAYTAWHWVWG